MENDTLRPGEAPARRRLYRTPDDKVVAGVCGGLGRYFDLDPVIFRIALAALTLAGGAGVLLYVVAWLAIPERGHRTSIGEGVLHRSSNGPAIGAVLLVVAAVIIVGNLFDGGFGAALLLMAAGGALLVWKRDDDEPRRGSPGTTGASFGDEDPGAPGYSSAPDFGATDFGEPRGFDDSHDFDGDFDDDEFDDGVTSTGYVRYRHESRRRGPRSYLGRLTVGLLLVVAGIFALGHAAELFDASLEGFLATALLITGLALVVGARFGRARGLIPLGVLLVALTAAAAFIDVPLRGGLGDRLYQPASRTELRDEYRLLAGQLELDLTRVDFGEGTTVIDASVAAGELRVLLPRRLDVEIEAEVAAGETDLLGSLNDGMGLDVTRADDTPSAAKVELHLEVGAGRVEVERAAA